MKEKHTNAPVGIVPLGQIISIEDLDRRVTAFDLGPHPEWVDAYLQKAKRRKASEN